MMGGGVPRTALATLVAVVLIGAAPAAAATAPATSGAGSAEIHWAGGPAAKSSAAVLPTTRSTGADRLPFSGIDFGFAVLVGGGLGLLGAGLRRLTARAPQN